VLVEAAAFAEVTVDKLVVVSDVTVAGLYVPSTGAVCAMAIPPIESAIAETAHASLILFFTLNLLSIRLGDRYHSLFGRYYNER
jgi:hypothetical protein